jgi:hypothetical protein
MRGAASGPPQAFFLKDAPWAERAVQVGGRSAGAVISGWDVRETDFPPSMDPRSLNFELAPGPEALGTGLDSLEVDLEEAPQVEREIVDIFGNPGSVAGARVASMPITTVTATKTGIRTMSRTRTPQVTATAPLNQTATWTPLAVRGSSFLSMRSAFNRPSRENSPGSRVCESWAPLDDEVMQRSW